MKPLVRKMMALAVLTAGVFAAHAQASVVIAGTRVIFPAQEREVTVRLTNDGKTPALVQTWVDNGEANETPEKISTPFLLSPPLFRLDPSKGQTLRLVYTKEPLAQDKESLFWLNVLEVPPKGAAEDDANKLQIAFRTRIKVIFRPQGLTGSADEAPEKVRWEIVRDGNEYVLKGTNSTPYIVNLGTLSLKSGGKTYDAGAGHIKPGETASFAVKELHSAPATGSEVEYHSINDWGGSVAGKQPVAAQDH
ncbi:molecular chaperone [Ralstonia sp. R-29]|uniref:fimbrial biogenesis chaperone n=1 Tax=Ralstonia sp. R-29 TaxID=3404059 RepID=UPI003CEADA3A